MKLRLNPTRSKYRNVKTVVDGITFDSKKEAQRYNVLKLLWKAGEISNLVIKPKFSFDIKKEHICNYIADFSYYKKSNDSEFLVVEDVKSPSTRKKESYRIKNKMMRAFHGIEIKEV